MYIYLWKENFLDAQYNKKKVHNSLSPLNSKNVVSKLISNLYAIVSFTSIQLFHKSIVSLGRYVKKQQQQKTKWYISHFGTKLSMYANFKEKQTLNKHHSFIQKHSSYLYPGVICAGMDCCFFTNCWWDCALSYLSNHLSRRLSSCAISCHWMSV